MRELNEKQQKTIWTINKDFKSFAVCGKSYWTSRWTNRVQLRKGELKKVFRKLVIQWMKWIMYV